LAPLAALSRETPAGARQLARVSARLAAVSAATNIIANNNTPRSQRGRKKPLDKPNTNAPKQLACKVEDTQFDKLVAVLARPQSTINYVIGGYLNVCQIHPCFGRHACLGNARGVVRPGKNFG
jgi:hypothetical protein